MSVVEHELTLAGGAVGTTTATAPLRGRVGQGG
jgi:hypothetical protein